MKQLWMNYSYYSKVHLNGMEKRTENDKDSWSLGQDLNPGEPEHEAGFLLTGPQCSTN